MEMPKDHSCIHLQGTGLPFIHLSICLSLRLFIYPTSIYYVPTLHQALWR